ncbi:MAG TPA: DUF6544 family protein, partial [Actinomycetota bacterium]|nr:DUF6544 family protein [Actinomycetota bacterium]
GGVTASPPPGPGESGPTAIAGRAANPVLDTWRQLVRARPPHPRFDPEVLDPLPEPAQRWLRHAIAPGTPLAGAVVLEMEGHIRLKSWIPFRAVQAEVPTEGYVWAARARLGPLSISGYDRYSGPSGEMHWRLFERLPVMSASGTDVSRSAACRLAIDAVFVPTTFLSPSVSWQQHPERPEVAIAVWTIGEEEHRLELTVDRGGRLRSVTARRWSNPLGEPWGKHPFGGLLSEEVTTGGITVPTVVHVGYYPETDRWAEGEFFRSRITSATYL